MESLEKPEGLLWKDDRRAVGASGREPAILSYRPDDKATAQDFSGLVSHVTIISIIIGETCASHVTFQAERLHLHSRER